MIGEKENKPFSEEEWKLARDKFRHMRISVMDHARVILKDKWGMWYEGKTQSLKKKIEATGFDKWKYLSYHVLFNSTPTMIHNDQLDFPGEFSVEQFYKEMLDELENIKK